MFFNINHNRSEFPVRITKIYDNNTNPEEGFTTKSRMNGHIGLMILSWSDQSSYIDKKVLVYKNINNVFITEKTTMKYCWHFYWQAAIN